MGRFYVSNINDPVDKLLMPIVPLWWRLILSYIVNTPVQYTVFFYGCKYYSFQMTKCDFFLTSYLDSGNSGYPLEPLK